MKFWSRKINQGIHVICKNSFQILWTKFRLNNIHVDILQQLLLRGFDKGFSIFFLILRNYNFILLSYVNVPICTKYIHFFMGDALFPVRQKI